MRRVLIVIGGIIVVLTWVVVTTSLLYLQWPWWAVFFLWVAGGVVIGFFTSFCLTRSRLKAPGFVRRRD